MAPSLNKSSAPNNCSNSRDARIAGYSQCRPDHGCDLIISAIQSSYDDGFLDDFILQSACTIESGAEYNSQLQAAKSALGQGCEGTGIFAALACGTKLFLDVSDNAIANTCSVNKANECMTEYRAWEHKPELTKRQCETQLNRLENGVYKPSEIAFEIETLEAKLAIERNLLKPYTENRVLIQSKLDELKRK